jgi:hypothetical protein
MRFTGFLAQALDTVSAALFSPRRQAAAPGRPADAELRSLIRPLTALLPASAEPAGLDTRNGHTTKRGPGRRHLGGRPYHARPEERPQTLFTGRPSSLAKLQRLPRCGADRGA